MIRCIYTLEPNFPATDQHPAAVRYWRLLDDSITGQRPAGGYKNIIDAVGAAPTLQEVLTFLMPPGPTPDELEAAALAALNGGGGLIDLGKLLKAKFISDLAFRLGVAPIALTPAQLAAERQRIANIYKAL